MMKCSGFWLVLKLRTVRTKKYRYNVTLRARRRRLTRFHSKILGFGLSELEGATQFHGLPESMNI
jgi:hypothetical protein